MNKPEHNDYTASQLAKLLSCSPDWVKIRLNDGRIKGYRLGGPTGKVWRIPWTVAESLKADWMEPQDTKQAL
jgi:hypothetical protein